MTCQRAAKVQIIFLFISHYYYYYISPTAGYHNVLMPIGNVSIVHTNPLYDE